MGRLQLLLPLAAGALMGLAACDRPAAAPGPGALLLTLELSSAGPRVLAQRHVGATALAAADRWGNLYFEARDSRGRLLVARDIDAPRGERRQLVLALPLRDGRATQLELFELDLTASTPTKRSLGRVHIYGETLARR